ncbi:hypothetical protein OIU74_007536 [Salix koriyanagi]|uniref:Pentatricopeptide repeat-containing protein n=1 Tax=Salix koriyanagi TaxID=2511006 RepID=A0A9Q0U409_9ROSI|nr:hypothetical protein OIU74_007536 [Salix koriyanagi]
MVVGYGRLGDGEEAMKLLIGMFQEDIRPDEITLTSIIRSCSCASTYCEIMQVNAHVLKNGLHAFVSIANALINAYSKGGSIAMALQCFSTVLEPDLVTWTSLIGAYAFHSLPKNSHWHDVARIHKLMRDRCGHRVPGCSWMEYAATIDEVPVKI